jgi:hypothetical protein
VKKIVDSVFSTVQFCHFWGMVVIYINFVVLMEWVKHRFCVLWMWMSLTQFGCTWPQKCVNVKSHCCSCAAPLQFNAVKFCWVASYHQVSWLCRLTCPGTLEILFFMTHLTVQEGFITEIFSFFTHLLVYSFRHFVSDVEECNDTLKTLEFHVLSCR